MTEEEQYLLREGFKAAYLSHDSVDKNGRVIFYVFQQNWKPREIPPYYALRQTFMAIERVVKDPKIGVRVQRQGMVMVWDLEGYIGFFFFASFAFV